MNNPFLAKTKDRESIIEHTEKLHKNFTKLKNTYPYILNLNWDLLELACLYHDLGKMNTKFQNKLIKKLNKAEFKKGSECKELIQELKDNFLEIEEIAHGYLSPAFLAEEVVEHYSFDERRILYQSIYFHHYREKLKNLEELQKIINEDLSKYIQDFYYEKIGKIEKLNDSFMEYIDRRIPDIEEDSEETIKKYIMTKGLLNKIDYSASADIDIEIENDNLFKKTDEFLKQGGFKPNKLQEYMINHQNDNNIIRASTGIGKTEAALFWIGNNKGFFTLPLKVSINAIFDRIIEKIHFPKEKTGLLHSDTSSEYLKRNNDELNMEQVDRTKQLSLPITVCTLDQLVDFIFKYEGYELKIATLSYSKLVIDEIQMYSPELVGFLIVALKHITEMGGKFSIVTATLPPIFLYLIDKQNIEYNKPEPFYKEINGQVQLRHRIKVMQEDINIDHVISNYKNKKVLIIVNTVKQAQSLYNQLNNILEDETEINLLHSRFIKKDRTFKEEEILELGDLKTKDSGIWITTQVVEASLDIDFDVLYTELSDISGLLQRMGRVYRNRELINEDINIFVYTGKNSYPSGISKSDKSIIDNDIFNLSKQALIEYMGNSDSKTIDEKDKMQLVEEVYSVENLRDSQYFKKIKNIINKMEDVLAYEYDKKNIDLRNIESTDIIPFSIYENYKQEVDKNLNIIEISHNFNAKILAKNKIRELVVSIPTYEFEIAKKNACLITEIELSKYSLIPVIDYEYTFEKGLIRPDFQDKVDNQFL
ncbi:CRISPR-associated helicase/endonuclease Cas3 [Clostridium botulinum]|uniref:CRISPR-associated helicase/endonuclease Cas3 n=1 Tax=Clostridium botulinum TaxID=1491 RepID=UPI0004D4BD2F|nr:CRISPR-associated helicase/endonuclease Cas3 [Clostridium botulinum]KEI06834.1 CRISPR-associated protein Cas3 [Clostridium botulinum C/D str. BKT75002]KEI11589.1 CRISPR-associated protein Cas3 [Clostridium botulinum C/D str. BKT2873]MCD3352069.1 CRISPR-associated helicase/endonuclease Cas3 [Clostridium botulinum D/C]MCD3361017.1 CRISPR-associated helicase/endonuclease Cas3 [Clostridium botulinum D/C]MCD3362923.1 CRISPR-associated helicase/endonuclease Cas3 [Clostridium botulinum D/C]